MCLIGLVLSLTSFTVPCSANALMSEKYDFTESELEQINDAISEYFILRNDVLKTANYAEAFCDNTVSDLSIISTDRINYNANLSENMNIRVVDSNNQISVGSIYIDNTSPDGSIVADIYEWNWIEYDSGGEKTDFMGYSTDHIISLEKKEDGNYVVSSDTYEDMFEQVANKSSNVNSLSPIQTTDDVFTDPFVPSEVVSSSGKNASGNVNYDVNLAIEYADKYVIKEYFDGMKTSYYNPEYGYYNNADCANYVSQCLKAGGMKWDYSASGKDYQSEEQWWSNTDTSATTCTSKLDPYSAISWRFVPSFVNYWKNQGYGFSIVTTSSDLYPGNPVICDWTPNNGVVNYNHAAICVGYNSSGDPIINSHNSDVYHVPYTFYNTATLYTIKIVSSNKMVSKPSTYTNITPKTTLQSLTQSTVPSQSVYYKFTVSSKNYYTFYSTGIDNTTYDSTAYLYKESESVNGCTMYMYEVGYDDNSGSNLNFKIRKQLEPGTYYLRVYLRNNTVSGKFKLFYQIG